MFGLYDFSGKATTFMGPWIVGAVTYFFGSQRIGMSAVLVFLLAGGVLLLYGQSAKSTIWRGPNYTDTKATPTKATHGEIGLTNYIDYLNR